MSDFDKGNSAGTESETTLLLHVIEQGVQSLLLRDKYLRILIVNSNNDTHIYVVKMNFLTVVLIIFSLYMQSYGRINYLLKGGEKDA